MKIKLSNSDNLYALIDDEDYDKVKKYSWRIDKYGYVVCNPGGKHIKMHRLIMDFPEGLDIDHRDQDNPYNKLDNRKDNLRVVTRGENQYNKKKIGNKRSSIYKGVSYVRQVGLWRAQIKFQKKSYWLGLFDTEELAALAYDEKAKELHGNFAVLNYPQD